MIKALSPVAEIEDEAFRKVYLRSIELPGSLQKLHSAFTKAAVLLQQMCWILGNSRQAEGCCSRNPAAVVTGTSFVPRWGFIQSVGSPNCVLSRMVLCWAQAQHCLLGFEAHPLSVCSCLTASFPALYLKKALKRKPASGSSRSPVQENKCFLYPDFEGSKLPREVSEIPKIIWVSYGRSVWSAMCNF